MKKFVQGNAVTITFSFFSVLVLKSRGAGGITGKYPGVRRSGNGPQITILSSGSGTVTV